VGGGALSQAATHDDILDFGGIDAGALDCMTQHVRRQRDTVVRLSAPRVARAMPVRQ
jgi:hypothetical protein